MKNLYTLRLQNAEHLAFMTDLSTLLKNSKLEILNDISSKLEEVVKKEELSQKEIRKSEYTEKLLKADESRATIYHGLMFRVKSELCSIKEPVRDAAKKIMLVIDTYGNFVNHNYQKETTEIQNLLEELKTKEYSAAVSAVGLSEWIKWLTAENNRFQDLYNARRDEYASRSDLKTKDIRKEGDVLFKEIKKMIDAMEILQKSKALDTLVAKINTSIDKWNEILALRNKKNASKANASEMNKEKKEKEEDSKEAEG